MGRSNLRFVRNVRNVFLCLTPDEAVDHSVDSGLGYRTGQVQNGTKHHNAETQQVWVQDSAAYQYCSGCGARR